MYLYSFDRFYGFDKVCLLGEQAGKKKVKPGDLLVIGNQYFLALWETISFPEQYQHLTTVQAELVYKEFLSAPALKLFHWMVEMYYTTYKSVVRLFVSNDLEKLLERESKIKLSKAKNIRIPRLWNLNFAETGQTLVVFPDLRTMFNYDRTIEQLNDGTIENNWVVILSATHTEKQKDVHRWEIKKWMKSVILCTYAEIFQDFNDLKKIIFIDPHKRYYANQQDPRYKVWDVVEEMKALYGAELEIVWV